MNYYIKYIKYKKKYLKLKFKHQIGNGLKISIVNMNSDKLLEDTEGTFSKYNTYVCNLCNEDVKELTMYHITSKDNATKILEEGFNINLSKMGAFGKGINLTTDILHLLHYYNINNEEENYIVVCKVKFYKKMLNTSGPEMIDEYNTKPKFETPPKGYDALYVKGPEIYVIPNSEQIKPLYIAKIYKT